MIKTLPKAKKFKNLAKSKKPELRKTTNKIFKIDFFIFEIKTTFLYLQTAFIKILIFYHFYPISSIWIKTNIFKYIISQIVNQLILNPNFSSYIIEKNSNFSKSNQ